MCSNKILFIKAGVDKTPAKIMVTLEERKWISIGIKYIKVFLERPAEFCF